MFHQVRIPDDLYKRISIHAADEERTTNAQIVRSLRALFPEPIAPEPPKPAIGRNGVPIGMKRSTGLRRDQPEFIPDPNYAEGITKSGAIALRRE